TFATRGRYQTHQKLSETPRAIVYEATHDVLGRRVALKVFRSTNPPDPARVLRDLSALALLRHPSNVRVHDAGTTATGPLGLPFVVMERVHGPTLRALLTKERRLSPARAARLIASALDGLAEAHAAGMTHRQLTPDHLLVADCDGPAESAKLIGYRIADRDADRSEPPPPMLQDAAYIAPEVMRDGAPITEQTDLYAAGALLYEAILGRRPPAALMLTSRSDPAPAHLHIPHALVELVHRAVSVDPHDRFESAAAFAAELRAAAGEEGEWAEPERATEPPPHASSTQRSLRSTGAPTLWFLTGDPALARPEVVGVLLRLRDRMRVEAITDDHRAALAARIREEEELPPWVVLFGDTHVLREDPLLDVLARTPEVSRLLVSAELDPEVVQAALNFGGLDHHVALSAAGDDLSPAIDRMVQRAGAARRYYDDLRLLAQRSPSVRHLRLARLG
ncbi:MAG: serine/threonine-protein kinase, partial [Polyangiaceae bacterium]